MSSNAPLPVLALSGFLSVFLAGCATGFSPSTDPSQSSLGTISGTAYGGRQPISGAHIYLLQASTAGYGGSTFSPTSSNASTSLLNSTTGNGPDSIGYYAVTDANGRFSITGEYNTCTAGDQVYLYSLGGRPDGVNTNSAAGLLAILGTCGSYGSSTTVNMNEVSTIAAAYAMAGFATDATHVGSGTTAAGKTGITNAFANAAQLFDTTSNPYGSPNTVARTTTPGSGTNGATGTVPQQQIDTLADILATCVNSSGPSYTQCSNLFSSGKSRLTTAATDTATEAIYMAQNPGNTSVYNLTGAQPYSPYYNTTPNDLSIAITFSGNGITRASTDSGFPGTVAVDGSSNVWVINEDTSTVSAFNHLGVPLTGSPFTGNGLDRPDGIGIDSTNRIWIGNFSENSANKESVSIFNDDGSANSDPVDNGTGCIDDVGNIAFDPSGNAWITQIGGYQVCKVNNAFTSYAIIASGALFNPGGVASDASGNMWVVNSGSASTNQVNKFNPSGSNINGSPFTGSQISETYGVAVDASGNAWISSEFNMLEITSTGTVEPAITGGGIIDPNGVAVDGDGHVWDADFGDFNTTTNAPVGDGALIELSNSRSILSGAHGYQSNSTYTGQGIAVDGSGDIWIDNVSANTVRELIGAAAPVVTPLSLAVKNNQIAARP